MKVLFFANNYQNHIKGICLCILMHINKHSKRKEKRRKLMEM